MEEEIKNVLYNPSLGGELISIMIDVPPLYLLHATLVPMNPLYPPVTLLDFSIFTLKTRPG